MRRPWRGAPCPGSCRPFQSEDDILRWLADEYGVDYATLDNIEPDRELLSLFPARVLLKEEAAAVASDER